MVGDSVNDPKIVVLVPIGSSSQQPDKRLHPRSQVVDESPRDILCLHRFIRTHPRRNRIEFVIEEWDVSLDPGIVGDQFPQRPRRFGLVSAVIHGFRIQVLTVAGISVIGIHIDSRGTLAGIESTLSEIADGVRLTAIDHFRLRIGSVHGFDKRSQEPSILLGIAPGIPIANVLFIPQSPIVDTIVKMIHHPGRVSIEGSDLLGRSRRPEDRIQTPVIIMKRSGLGNTHVRPLAAGRGVHHVAIDQLHLDIDSVVDQRVHKILEFRRAREYSAFLLDPVPAGAVRAIFILPDAGPFETGIEHARPPPAVPWEIGIARQVGVDAEPVADLRRPLGWNVVGNRARSLSSRAQRNQKPEGK